MYSTESPTATCTAIDVDTDLVTLRVVEGPDAGATFELTERVTLGTGRAATLRLSDRGVSRIHCEVEPLAGRVRLRDHHSKNGTWLSGCRVREVELAPGTRIRVGATVIDVHVERKRIIKSVWSGPDYFGPLIGGSKSMHRLFALLARLAPTPDPVLVRGESGTGKELIARAIHDNSQRREGPFVIVDAGALSQNLADVELFGHDKGAFTGAELERAGAFERAHGGTVFLDEIGDLPLELQPKLLRVLEDGTVQRLGDGARRRVDVRVVSATHRPLEEMVNDGSFREDLLFRLRVMEVESPPLRDRGLDVQALAFAFLERVAPNDHHARATLEQALQSHASYRWPGNVRELRSFVRRVAFMGDAVSLYGVEDDKPVVRADLPYHDAKKDWLTIFEMQYLSRLLDETSGNISEAARRAGINRSHLSSMVDRLNLK